MKRPKHLPLPNTRASIISEIVRVDLAGEYGAKRIYEGQLAVLKEEDSLEVKEMYQQELKHLKYFQDKLPYTKTRPTLLHPLWHVLGFAMGAATAMLGKKAAMACTVAVEDVIEKHYQSQITTLKDEISLADEQVNNNYLYTTSSQPNFEIELHKQNVKEDQELLQTIIKFREEEISHRDSGIEHKAKEAFGYKVLYNLIQSATKAAIFLSKKI